MSMMQRERSREFISDVSFFFKPDSLVMQCFALTQYLVTERLFLNILSDTYFYSLQWMLLRSLEECVANSVFKTFKRPQHLNQIFPKCSCCQCGSSPILLVFFVSQNSWTIPMVLICASPVVKCLWSATLCTWLKYQRSVMIENDVHR